MLAKVKVKKEEQCSGGGHTYPSGLLAQMFCTNTVKFPPDDEIFWEDSQDEHI